MAAGPVPGMGRVPIVPGCRGCEALVGFVPERFEDIGSVRFREPESREFMGYGTLVYGVDIARLRSTYGSQDQTLLKEMEREYADDLRQNDERFRDEIRRGAPPLREALAQIVRGKITGKQGTEFQYGYAVELLCKHLGRPLENEDLIEFVDDLEIPTGVLSSGPPLPIPPPLDFPVIGFLTAEQVREEYAQLKDQDFSHDDEDIEAAREEFRSYLRQANDQGLGIVVFAY